MPSKSLGWPIFIVFAICFSALIWKYYPSVKNTLPNEAAKRVQSLISAFRGDSGSGQSSQESDEEERKVIFVDQNGNVISNNIPSVQAPSNTASNIETAEKENDDKKERPAAAWGINRVGTLHAKWAVLQKTTPVIKLNDEVMGNAPAGSVFFIEKRIPTASGMLFEGHFNSKKMTKKVRIDASYVISFSGDYNKLSERQKEFLKKYYELNGKAEERKTQVLKENLAKSPYLAKAAAALKKYNAASKRLKELKDMPEDFRRKATYKLSHLKSEIQELNQKHKEWKEQHRSELNDYVNDPKYIEIIAEREKFHDEIPGLAY